MAKAVNKMILARSESLLSKPPAWTRLRRRALIAVSLILATGVCLLWRSIPAWLDRREGLRLAQQGRFADAEPLLQRVLERNADDLEVVKALARGNLEANRLTEAVPYFERWCALRPGEAEPYQRRMELWLRLQWLPQAVADGQRVLELEPDNDPLRERVAHLSLVIGQYPDAERECRRCLQRRPDETALRLLLAKVCHRQGRIVEAEAIADSLIRENPHLIGPLVLRATLYSEADQPELAIPLLREALALDENAPSLNDARYYLSLALARTGQAEEAQRVMADMEYRRILKLYTKEVFPDNPGLQLRLAEALLATGKPEEARDLLKKILARDPHCSAAHRLLASYYDKQGQPDRAAEHLRQAGP